MTRPESGGSSYWSSEHERYGDATHESWSSEFTTYGQPTRPIPTSDIEDSIIYSEYTTVAKYEVNDRVVSTKNVGGGIFSTVPRGTEGVVIGRRSGFFSDYVTVQFVNGYTEEVKDGAIEKVKGWF